MHNDLFTLTYNHLQKQAS